ncbi:unnamed protein product [Owenia fusiformis]|uniref:Hexosyltransferase n=1 Tax=Owenia fusiformis TaxID=6347 RepID=A0A8S4N052_OWEFU|nr:unnamed protein product [Owenia fusiformis]
MIKMSPCPSISRRQLLFTLSACSILVITLQLISTKTMIFQPKVTVQLSSTTDACATCITSYNRPETCDNCFAHNFNYTINNRNLCKSIPGSPRVEILVLVTSSAHEKDRRDAIRNTWGVVASPSSSLRLAFLLGKHSNDTVNALLREENKLHYDLIQEDFEDSYMNLTLKSVMALKWAVNFCKNTDYIMKTDSDMFINLDNLKDILKENPLGNEIGGFAKPPESPIRDPHSKWYTPESFYPNSTFPWTFSGTGYVMKYEVAKDVLAMSKNTPFFHLEDIYIAFNIHKLGYGVKFLDGFSTDRTFLDPTYYCACVTSSHQLLPRDLYQIWKEMDDMKCSVVRKTVIWIR